MSRQYKKKKQTEPAKVTVCLLSTHTAKRKGCVDYSTSLAIFEGGLFIMASMEAIRRRGRRKALIAGIKFWTYVVAILLIAGYMTTVTGCYR